MDSKQLVGMTVINDRLGLGRVAEYDADADMFVVEMGVPIPRGRRPRLGGVAQLLWDELATGQEHLKWRIPAATMMNRFEWILAPTAIDLAEVERAVSRDRSLIVLPTSNPRKHYQQKRLRDGIRTSQLKFLEVNAPSLDQHYLAITNQIMTLVDYQLSSYVISDPDESYSEYQERIQAAMTEMGDHLWSDHIMRHSPREVRDRLIFCLSTIVGSYVLTLDMSLEEAISRVIALVEARISLYRAIVSSFVRVPTIRKRTTV